MQPLGKTVRLGGADAEAGPPASPAAPAPSAPAAARSRAGLCRGRGGRIVACVLVVCVLAVGAAFGAGLSPEVLERWAADAGWWLPAAFVIASGVLCMAPVPRTAFTVAAGVLFPPVWGVVLALSGAMIAAVLTFLVGRALGREAVERRLTHPAARAVEDRLRRRGWLAVGSLRLIPVVPFSVLNYCCSVSGVRLGPYAAATLVGSAPGTIAVVCFSDALASGPGWVSVALSSVAVVAGASGLVVDWWLDRPARAGEARGPAGGSDAPVVTAPAAGAAGVAGVAGTVAAADRHGGVPSSS